MYSISTKSSWINLGFFSYLLLFLLSSKSLWGQILQKQGLEIPLSWSETQYDVINAGTDGLFLYREFDAGVQDAIHLVKIDTAFQQQWGGFIGVEKNYRLMAKRMFGQKLFLLYRYQDFSRNNFLIYTIQPDGTYYAQTVKGYIPIMPTEFYITEKAALIGGYYNHVPLVLYFSFTTGKSRVVPGMFNENGELTQVKTYEDGSFDVLISAFNYERKRTIWIKNYDSEGNLNSNFALLPQNNKHLIFGRSVKTSDNTKLIAGVYGGRSSEFSQGVFIASVDAAGAQQIRYYNFADLENFFKYMTARRELRVKSRIERRKIKGKRVRFNYRFQVNEIVPFKDQFVLLGEAFYPKYINPPMGTTGSFFSPTTGYGFMQNGRIFDGYYYTHAVVMGFDPKGNLKWDNSFEINDAKTFTLEQFVKLEVLNDKIALMYLFNNKIRTKIIQNNQVLEGKNADPIKTSKGEVTSKNSPSVISKLEYWYDNCLYAFGVHVLEREKFDSERKRVFYVNKIRSAK
jgi:hypothetical protein